MTGRQPPAEAVLLQGTCLDFGGVGVLLAGGPGSGKSDLALRLIDQPGHGTSGFLWRAALVSDDQVLVRREDDRLIASAPATIAGQIEVRGLGIVSLANVAATQLTLVVNLIPFAAIERLPDLPGQSFEALGVSLPRIDIDPRAASAPARLRAALDWFHRA